MSGLLVVLGQLAREDQGIEARLVDEYYLSVLT